jgi:predicted GIY-YIG superfamily endonuclease
MSSCEAGSASNCETPYLQEVSLGAFQGDSMEGRVSGALKREHWVHSKVIAWKGECFDVLKREYWVHSKVRAWKGECLTLWNGSTDCIPSGKHGRASIWRFETGVLGAFQAESMEGRVFGALKREYWVHSKRKAWKGECLVPWNGSTECIPSGEHGRASIWRFETGVLGAFQAESMEGRVSGALKREYSCKEVNSDRKSVVLQQVGGIDLRLTSSRI